MIGARHPVLARMRRLARQRKARTDEAAFVIDGPTLLDEALQAGVEIEEVVAETGVPATLLERVDGAGAPVHQAAVGTLARVSDTVTPQPVAAIARLPQLDVAELLDTVHPAGPVLVLVGVNDPGNAGTLLRSAEAAGVGAAIFCDESVDPYGPKCVRGSAGSVFRLAVVRNAGATATLDQLHEQGWRHLGAVARDGDPYDQVDLLGPVAIVLGSEAHGLPDAIVQRLDRRVTIPMAPPVESLNVAMAGTLLCFEAARQLRAVTDPALRKLLDRPPTAGAGFSAA